MAHQAAYQKVKRNLRHQAQENTTKPVGGDLKTLPEVEEVEPGQNTPMGYRETITYLYMINLPDNLMMPQHAYVYNTEAAYYYLIKEVAALPPTERFQHNHPCFMDRVMLYHEYNEAVRRQNNPLVVPTMENWTQIMSDHFEHYRNGTLTADGKLLLRSLLDIGDTTAFAYLPEVYTSQLPEIAKRILRDPTVPEKTWILRRSRAKDNPLCVVRTLSYKKAINEMEHRRIVHLSGFGYFEVQGQSSDILPTSAVNPEHHTIPKPYNNRVFPCLLDLIDYFADELQIIDRTLLLVPTSEQVASIIQELPQPGTQVMRNRSSIMSSFIPPSNRNIFRQLNRGNVSAAASMAALGAAPAALGAAPAALGAAPAPAAAAAAAAPHALSMAERIPWWIANARAAPTPDFGHWERIDGSRMAHRKLMNGFAANPAKPQSVVPNRGKHAHMMGNLPPPAAATAAAFVAAPEAPAAAAAPMRLRDLPLQQLLDMQDARCPGLYNLSHNVLVHVMDANPNIRFVIRKGSNTSAVLTTGNKIQPPSNVLVYYKLGQVVKMPLDNMSETLSELFFTDEEKNNNENRKEAKATNKAILNDMDNNNYGFGLVEPDLPDSPEIVKLARQQGVKFHLTRNHLLTYIQQQVDFIRWKLTEMGYAVTDDEIKNAFKQNYTRSSNNVISNLSKAKASYAKTRGSKALEAKASYAETWGSKALEKMPGSKALEKMLGRPSSYPPSGSAPGSAAAMPGGRRVKCYTRAHKKSRRTHHKTKHHRK